MHPLILYKSYSACIKEDESLFKIKAKSVQQIGICLYLTFSLAPLVSCFELLDRSVRTSCHVLSYGMSYHTECSRVQLSVCNDS